MGTVSKLNLVIPTLPPARAIPIDDLRRALAAATDPFEIKEINAKADAFEQYMHDCGLYSIEDMRPINELRMQARSKLGRVLAEIDRVAGPGRGKKNVTRSESFMALLRQLELEWKTARDAQRIGDLPDYELLLTFDQWRERGELLHYADLIVIARPYWYKESREVKHRTIHEAAIEHMRLDCLGPFPLIYADPPWQFEIYSEKGAERTPDQHYPTLSDDEIKRFQVDGKPIAEIAHENAALLLWCTSSNMHRALGVMTAWGFEFKSSAVWVKSDKPDETDALTRFGLGLVFRNMHEVLLYGTRSNMPGPQYQPPSVFFYPRGAHSAKPPEIRTEIEKMYPSFDERTRLELFARESREPCVGWSRYGFEA